MIAYRIDKYDNLGSTWSNFTAETIGYKFKHYSAVYAIAADAGEGVELKWMDEERTWARSQENDWKIIEIEIED